VAHFAKTRTRGGGDASGATTRTRDDGARDGGEGIAPRALVCVFERPRRARDERDGSESESESERETAETTAGAAYGTRVEIRRWTRDSNVGGVGDGDRDDDAMDGDGTMDSDSEDAYGGYSSSSSEDVVKRMKRLRTRPLGTCERIALTDDDKPHVGSIRAFRASADGKWFITAGDDKLVKLWSVDGWRCARTICGSKKISSACFTPDSKHFIFADKFGEVHACEIGSDKEPVLMLGHCSTIITDVECVEGGDRGYLLTADREHKTRVSVLPKPEDRTRFSGSAPEIQSFCYGHSAYVSCVRPIVQPARKKKTWKSTKDVFLTGGGDASVRMWDATTGKETDPHGAIEFHRGEICDIATRAEGTHVAVAIENKKALAVVHLTEFRGVPKLFLVGFGPEWTESPQSIKFDRNMVLWGTGVRANEDGSNTAVIMREGTVVDGLELTLSAEESSGTTRNAQLRKREITDQERHERKKNRKDMQLKAANVEKK
jgi:tRNA (guanine-N(7)-)-methyltransferase subunit TRM82